MAVHLVESRQAIRSYQDREVTNRLLFAHVPTASAHVELDGVFRVANRRFTRFLGYPDDGLDGTAASLVIEPSELQAMLELHRTLLGGDVAEAELPHAPRPQGRTDPRRRRCAWVIVRDGAGAAQYTLVTILDDRRLALA